MRPHGLYSPWNSPGQNTGVGSLSLLQGIFPTQGSNPGLPHCRRILYQLSHKGSPFKETYSEQEKEVTVTVSECLLCARPCAKCFPIASSPQLVGGGGVGTTTATVRALVSQKRMLRLPGVTYISWKMVEWEPHHRVQSLLGLTASKLDLEGVLVV